MRALLSKNLVALSKPRCGSTSLRRMIDPHLAPGDIAVDTAGQLPSLHPHITGPFLAQYLCDRRHDVSKLSFIITVRDPIEMLWSYWKYFKPDILCRYTFTNGWDASAPLDFETWVCTGKLAIRKELLELGPSWISVENLSPLSLEARAAGSNGELMVDHIFRLENAAELAKFLSEVIGTRVSEVRTNESYDKNLPKLGCESRNHIRSMFPLESQYYGV